MLVAVFVLFGNTLAYAPQNDPQREYDEYIASLSKYEAVAGVISGSGGPVGKKQISVFRIKRGGKYTIFSPDREEHCDGKKSYTYSPSENRYILNDQVGGGMFFVAFGRAFFPNENAHLTVLGASDGEFHGSKVRVFKLLWVEHEIEIELFVRKENSLPVGWRQYGEQSMYETQLVEIVLGKLSDASFEWSPPKGAVQSKVIRGGLGGVTR
ncbi:MAG TPA: hypothetical protein VNK96_08740 [Fimbriimonadales bacterium]|nr:hypothetical protein [Fimbriimonadales bacterium]